MEQLNTFSKIKIKKCQRCDTDKDIHHFSIRRDYIDGYMPFCKDCDIKKYKTKQPIEITNLENEEWRDVVGYEGLYSISNLLRVKRAKRTVFTSNGGQYLIHEKILAHIKHHSGYIVISLTKSAKYQNIELHRLVAMAFLPNPNNLPEVNHKNMIRNDNKIDNLEWVSIRENITHGRKITKKHTRYVGVYKTSKSKWTAICTHNGKKIIIGLFSTEKAAAEKYNEKLKELGIENRYNNVIE